MAYEFHYTPTGTGAISGAEVLEQTEDAINDLGNTAISDVQEALDKAERAFTNSANAVDDAQTALNTANNAEGVAIQAQNDVSNLSGTVTNIGNRVTTAEGNIGNLQGRMTTAEGNITNLQGRMTTAESNIGNLQTAVSTAQATANSAQQTATTARQQSYVFRYSSTVLVASSTNSNALLDNTDNLKVGDKVIDSSGVLFSITAIDTQNSTFTIGTALIDLAQDSDVVHRSGDETVGGIKTFSNNTYITSLNFTNEVESQSSSSSALFPIVTTVTYADQSPSQTARLNFSITANGDKSLYPHENNQYALGLTSRKWSEVHGVTYYYGSSDTEFSQKFVTTDTAQTVGGQKIFTHNATGLGRDSFHFAIIPYGKNTPPAKTSYQYVFFSGNTASQGFMNSWYGGYIEQLMNPDGSARGRWFIRDTSESTVVLELFVNGSDKQVRPQFNNTTDLGTSTNKWKSFNGLEPSALGMPDLSNGIDISSYITVVANGNKESLYTPPANGWISVRLSRTSGSLGVLLIQGGMATSGKNIEVESGATTADAMLPVVGGVQVSINSALADGVVSAYFYPCLGNV